jgi:hypothetical protein
MYVYFPSSLGRFGSWDILKLGSIVIGMFVVRTCCGLVNFETWDVAGTLCVEMYCICNSQQPRFRTSKMRVSTVGRRKSREESRANKCFKKDLKISSLVFFYKVKSNTGSSFTLSHAEKNSYNMDVVLLLKFQ